MQFCYQDSPRRAHSIAAQGGINAAKNYRNDGDSIHRLFYDTVKGGDFRARESNVHRLAADLASRSSTSAWPRACRSPASTAACSTPAPSAASRSPRTFYARGQTGQQLLLGAYQALSRQIAAGNVEMHPRTEMLDLIVVDGRARGIVARDLVTGEIDTLLRGRRGAGHRRLRQRLLPVDERHELQRHRDLAGPPARRATSPTPASPRSTRPASRAPATTSPS